jgi:cell division protein FtsW
MPLMRTLIVQSKRHFIDWWLFVPMVLLLIIGYIMVFSTTSFKGLSEFNDAYYFIKRHSFFLMGGMALFFIGAALPTKKIKHGALIGYALSIGLLLVTLIPSIGVQIGGASRWLNVFGFQFQPVEVAKFWWVIAVSVVLSKKSNQIVTFLKGVSTNKKNDNKQAHRPKSWVQVVLNGVLPVVIVMVIPIFCMMLQPDLGNAILTMSVGLSLLLISSVPMVVLVVAAMVSIGMVAYSIFTHDYQMQRIESFLNPWLDPLGANYHIIQSFTAIGSGGWWGFGIGESRLKYFYLPLHYSDFIFSILCEEGGLFLAVVVIMVFSALFVRGIQISLKHPRYSFEQFAALALTLFLIGQAIINICVVIGLFPITGIPLTFISYGGSSLLSSMFCLGVLNGMGRGL